MHNRLWLSLLLAIFLTVSGCARNEETAAPADSAAADSNGAVTAEQAATPEPKPVAPAASAATQSAAESSTSKESEHLLKDSSAAPEKADARNRADMAKPEAEKPRAAREAKQEMDASQEKIQPSGDDMERMD